MDVKFSFQFLSSKLQFLRLKVIQKLAIVVMTLTLLTMNALPVFAAKPANHACLGKDISGYARSGETDPTSIVSFGPGAGFGEFIANLARGTQGVGDEFQSHLAGSIPDAIISNSCDP